MYQDEAELPFPRGLEEKLVCLLSSEPLESTDFVPLIESAPVMWASWPDSDQYTEQVALLVTVLSGSTYRIVHVECSGSTFWHITFFKMHANTLMYCSLACNSSLSESL